MVTLVVAPGYGKPTWATIARPAIVFTIGAIALIRFGVLAIVASVYTNAAISYFPLTTNWSAWYTQAALLSVATLVALALYGFVTTLKGSPLRPKKLDAT